MNIFLSLKHSLYKLEKLFFMSGTEKATSFLSVNTGNIYDKHDATINLLKMVSLSTSLSFTCSSFKVTLKKKSVYFN